MHLNDEQIQRLLHDELDSAARVLARDHLAQCASCTDRLDRARKEEGEVFGLLGSLDAPAPQATVGTIIERANRREPVAWRWAAVIVVALGTAAVAYALPGSPVRGWLKTLVNATGASSDSVRLAAPRPTRSAGIAVAPGSFLLIEFQSRQERGRATVRLTDGPDVVVRSADDSATFTTASDRLLIDNHGLKTDFEIEIPREAPHIEIAVGGRRFLLKEGSRVTSAAPADSGGVFFLDLSSSR